MLTDEDRSLEFLKTEGKMIVNTPKGKLGSQDDSYVRKAAIKYKIPYIATTAAAFAAARGIRARKEERGVIRSLQEYHADLRG